MTKKADSAFNRSKAAVEPAKEDGKEDEVGTRREMLLSLQRLTILTCAELLIGRPASSFTVRTSATTEFCGIRLGPAAKKLCSELALGSGKPVSVVCNSFPGTKGHSGFQDDGTPTIFLNPNEANEEIVVHEISHMLLRLQGYPRLLVTPDQNVAGRAQWRNWSALLDRIDDDIAHRVFNPSLRRLGFSPQLVWAQELKKITPQYGSSSIRVAAETLFRTRMEEGPSGVDVKKVEGLFMANRGEAAVQLAQEMEKAIGNVDNWTPSSVVEGYVRCSNAFLFPELRVTFQGWSPTQLGKVAIQVADLTVSFLSSVPSLPKP